MAHKALKAHTSPAPKSNARTLSAHIFPEEIAPTSPRLQIGPWVTPGEGGDKLIN